MAELLKQGAAQIVVVDNSPLSFDTFGGSSPSEQIEHVRTGRNLGYGRAHNIAMRKFLGVFKYHLVCNPDIELSAGVLSGLVQYMDQNLDVGLCMPMLRGTNQEMQYCCRRSPVAWDYISQLLFPRTIGARRRSALEMRSSDYTREMEVECLSGCFMLFRSSVLDVVGGFDERYFMYFEDLDISRRLNQLARAMYIPAVSVIHERQSGHRTSWRLKIAFAVSAWRYFWRWGFIFTEGASLRRKAQ